MNAYVYKLIKYVVYLQYIMLNLPSKAPKASPASLPLFILPIAAMAENISGAPLPKANNVTPYH